MTSPTISLLDRAGLDRDDARRHLAHGLEGADDGELFLEYCQSEMLAFDNGRLKQATYDTSQGFGLRAVKDEAVGYAHASDLSAPALARAADAVRAVKGGYTGHYAEAPGRTNVRLYGDDNPLGAPTFETKVRLLETIDAYARAKDARVRQVTVSFGTSWQVVEILRADGETYRDIRPLVRVNVSIVAGDGTRQETGSYGYGGREGFDRFMVTESWQHAVDEAARQALVMNTVPRDVAPNAMALNAMAGRLCTALGALAAGVLIPAASVASCYLVVALAYLMAAGLVLFGMTLIVNTLGAIVIGRSRSGLATG